MTTSTPALAALADRVEGDRARVGALGARDDLAAGALGPPGELLDGGGAEGVGGAEHDRSCRARCCRCQASLPIVVVLPVPLTPATMITVGSWRRSMRSSPGPGDVGQQLTQPLRQRLAALDGAGLGLLLELADDLGRRARADVGHDQRLLEALPRLLVERALEQRRLDLGAERLARLGEVLAQAAEEPAPLCLGLGVVGGPARSAVAGEEEVGPVAGHAVRDDSARGAASNRSPPTSRPPPT